MSGFLRHEVLLNYPAPRAVPQHAQPSVPACAIGERHHRREGPCSLITPTGRSLLSVCAAHAGFPDGFHFGNEGLRAVRKPCGASGIRYRRPPVKKRAPFVRGCVPEDTGPSHDTGRVCMLTQCQVPTTTRPCKAHRWQRPLCRRFRPSANFLAFTPTPPAHPPKQGASHDRFTVANSHRTLEPCPMRR